jgi:2-polyprenyl-3-methyl-5-hydroxy-6-metoxy-1,4-benzoquinol methylase
MGDCCNASGYERVFGGRFAARRAARYRRRGLDPTARRMVAFLNERGLKGASVLEIGGGVGEIQVELLRLGARSVTNLEISTGYEEEAAELLKASGLQGRVERRLLDIARAPDAVAPADVVVLHRVVCCYPDYERLLTAAGTHARRLLVFSHPPRNLLSRAAFAAENLMRQVQGRQFRVFVHPPAAMVAVLNATGLATRVHYRGRSWHAVGLER